MMTKAPQKPQGPDVYKDNDQFELTLRGKHSPEHLPHEIPVTVHVEFRQGEELEDEWWRWSVFFADDVDGRVPHFEDEALPDYLRDTYEADIEYRVQEHIQATW